MIRNGGGEFATFSSPIGSTRDCCNESMTNNKQGNVGKNPQNTCGYGKVISGVGFTFTRRNKKTYFFQY
jgi:hypothetical protein